MRSIFLIVLKIMLLPLMLTIVAFAILVAVVLNLHVRDEEDHQDVIGLGRFNFLPVFHDNVMVGYLFYTGRGKVGIKLFPRDYRNVSRN